MQTLSSKEACLNTGGYHPRMDPYSGAVGMAIGRMLSRAERSDGLLRRLFGPACDEIGQSLAQTISGRRQANVERILENADTKGRTDAGPASMRMAGLLIGDASFCEDTVMAEYVGGVLASSREHGETDDRAVRWGAMVTSMAAYDVRMHYVLYAAAHRAVVAAGEDLPWANRPLVGNRGLVCVPWHEFGEAMALDEADDWLNVIHESLWTLDQRGLIDNMAIADADGLRRYGREIQGRSAVMFVPTVAGIRLFLYAHGMGHVTTMSFNSSQLDLQPLADIPPTPGATMMSHLPEIPRGPQAY